MLLHAAPCCFINCFILFNAVSFCYIILHVQECYHPRASASFISCSNNSSFVPVASSCLRWYASPFFTFLVFHKMHYLSLPISGCFSSGNIFYLEKDQPPRLQPTMYRINTTCCRSWMILLRCGNILDNNKLPL